MQQAILIFICCSILVYISIYDIFYRRISNRAVLLFAGVCGISAVVKGGVGIFGAFAGAGTITAIMVALNLIVRTFGGGDIKLLAAGALSLGVKGILRAFSVGILMAGCWCIFLWIRGKSLREKEIPMGVFFSLGMFLAWIRGQMFV